LATVVTQFPSRRDVRDRQRFSYWRAFDRNTKIPLVKYLKLRRRSCDLNKSRIDVGLENGPLSLLNSNFRNPLLLWKIPAQHLA
jgi:hypothetical protein